MSTPAGSGEKSSNRVSIPRWMAPIAGLFAFLVAIPLAHGVVPWAISLLAPHYGWTAGRAGIWNLFGLVPVVAASASLLWIMVLGLAQTSKLPERVALDWTPKLLLRRGPYAFTRNPMYVAELALWLGWAIFFGSVPVSIGFVVLCVLLNLVVRREERDLAKQFGEGYLQYKAAVPRWLGKVRH